MNTILKNQIERTLALALVNFKDQEEALTFLKDFLTEKELETLAKRLSILYWSTKNRDYINIQNNLKVEKITISDTKKLIKKESIKKALANIDADIWAEKWSEKIKNFLSFQAL